MMEINIGVNFQNMADLAKKALKKESQALDELAQRLSVEFFGKTLDALWTAKGRVVVCGVGKSALVAQKMVATFNSTGTPSQFLHASDALHGDVGMVCPDDVVLMLSKSGASAEVEGCVGVLRKAGVKIVAITARQSSFLAANADIVLQLPDMEEVDAGGIVPTTSTTLQMALGDALAICLMEMRGFGSDEFAKNHPSGVLGKSLHLTVGEMAARHGRPFVGLDTPFKDVIIEMTNHRLGAVAVFEELEGRVVGIVTDGDIRRWLLMAESISGVIARDLMSAKPKTISSHELVSRAMRRMSENKITQLVVEDDGRYVGMVHLHDLLNEGVVPA